MAATSGSCYVYHAQHKSAGVTFMAALVSWVSFRVNGNSSSCEHCDRCGAFACRTCDNYKGRWSWEDFGCRKATSAALVQQQPRLLTNGFVLPLAMVEAWRRPTCVWITVFREPLSRLVSAFFFCKHAMDDPLCARHHVNTRGGRLEGFANHWGSFGFRELLLYPPLRAIATNTTGPPETHNTNFSAARDVDPMWWVWKQIVHAHDRGEDLAHHAGARNFAALATAFPGMYDLVGILERRAETCALLDARLPWLSLSASAGRGGSNGRHWCAELATHTETHSATEKWSAADEAAWVAAALAEARNSSAIAKALDADVRVYRTLAVPRFEGLLSGLHT